MLIIGLKPQLMFTSPIERSFEQRTCNRCSTIGEDKASPRNLSIRICGVTDDSKVFSGMHFDECLVYVH
jgi:hypothetical protein